MMTCMHGRSGQVTSATGQKAKRRMEDEGEEERHTFHSWKHCNYFEFVLVKDAKNNGPQYLPEFVLKKGPKKSLCQIHDAILNHRIVHTCVLKMMDTIVLVSASCSQLA